MLKLEQKETGLSFEASRNAVLKTCRMISHLFADLEIDKEEEEVVVPIPNSVDMAVANFFFTQLLPQWTDGLDDLARLDFRTLSKHEFSKTMTDWLMKPTPCLNDFERLSNKQQWALGRLGWQMDIPCLETLYMLFLVRKAQLCDNIAEWQHFITQATGKPFDRAEQKQAVFNAVNTFSFLDRVSPPFLMSEEQQSRTGAKRPACED